MTATPQSPSYGIAPRGYRLPAATHVGRVRLQVTTLDRSLAFYTEILGMRVLARDGASVSLGARGDDTVLVELHEKPGAAAVPRRGRLGLYHFAILVPDRASLARFVAHLSNSGTYAGMSDHLVSEAIYLQDPDNLGIEVYADRPRSAWALSGQEIAMATAPLDMADLLRAAGREPWRGLPAGTRIGHVHLHVGSLPEAERFYHDALGLDKVVWSYPGALFLSAGGYHHHLGTNTWAKDAQPAAEDEARLVEWEIVVPDAGDADAARASAERAGYATESASGHAFRVRDPWGTTVLVGTA